MQARITDIAVATGGRLVQMGSTDLITSVGTDSRAVQRGELFIALCGERFDGHDFVTESVRGGASAVVVSKAVQVSKEVSVIVVEDTLRALGDIAAWWRGRFSIPCVAITGSNGKSTTKAMTTCVAAVLGSVHASQGNFNNLVGLPLSLFGLESHHRAVVLEMGMSARGEIRRLAEIAQPTIGVITNIAAAHLEKIGSQADVARAKGELFEAMKQDGIAIIHGDDDHLVSLVKSFPGRVIRFGKHAHADVRLLTIHAKSNASQDVAVLVSGKEMTLTLPVCGLHNALNALAALSVGVALGVDPQEAVRALLHFTPIAMRCETFALSKGCILINDTYNANPGSMAAAFELVRDVHKGKRFVAVLGDMLELGHASAHLHEEVGRTVVTHGAQELFAFGNFSRDVLRGAQEAGLSLKQARAFEDMERLIAELAELIKQNDVILVKGSRGMKMERVVEALRRQ